MNGTMTTASMPLRPAEANAVIPVLFVLLPNVLMLDLAGPAEVLRLASQRDADAGDARRRFELRYVGPVDQIQTSIGLPLADIQPLPKTLPSNAVVVIVGVSSYIDENRRAEFDAACDAVIAWLGRVAVPLTNRVMCVCSGALIAARAGLLNGRHVTTHHALCNMLRTIAPCAKVLENRLYVTDGLISSSAGITAGIDMMLQLLADLDGPRVACSVARDMVVYMRRSGNDPQLSPWLAGRNHLHPALHRVQDAIVADPAREWTAVQMARIACSSTRHLGRLFLEYTGETPVDYIHRLRIAIARDLAAQSSLGMEAIAERAGFGSSRQMRRVWQKYEPVALSKGRRVLKR